MSKQTTDRLLRGLERAVEICGLILFLLPLFRREKKSKTKPRKTK